MIGSSLTWYKVLGQSYERIEQSFERQPTVARDIQRLKDQAPKIKTADDLLKDRRSLQVVLSAFQLESEIDKKAILRKILTQPLDDDKSFANRMVDPRYKKLAQALQPILASGQGLSGKAVDGILAGYKVNEFEKAQGEKADGVREALYFKRSIGKITDLSQIMADKTLMKVVRVAMGFPPQFGALEYEQQKSRLTSRVDVTKFQDPKYVEKFVQRFLIMNEQETGGNTKTDPMVSLIQPVSSSGGFQPIGIDFLI